MHINVTFPVFNEEAQLVDSVRQVARFVSGMSQYSWEFIIADNGSRDHTLEAAQAIARECETGPWLASRTDLHGTAAGGLTHLGPPLGNARTPHSWLHRALSTAGPLQVKVLHWDEPGRGRALQGAWLTSTADVLTYMDIDLSTDLAHLPELVATVAEGRADMAIGSRLSPSARVTRGWKREALSRGYNRLLQSVLGLKVDDAQCGFKAISRAAARALLPRIRDTGFFFDTELLVLAQWEGWRIQELPVRWTDDADSRVHLPRTIWSDLQGVWRLLWT